MAKECIKFEDLTTDKDGLASKTAFVRLARDLIEEGRRPDRVFRAMLSAAYAASLERSIGEHYALVRYAAEDVADWKRQLEKVLDTYIAEDEQASEAIELERLV